MIKNYAVTFKPMKEASVSWILRNGVLHVTLTDYLKDAPADITEEICVWIDARLDGKRGSLELYKNWVNDTDFRIRHRPTYMRRSKNLACTDVGKHRSLTDSLDRLLEKGYIVPSDIEDSCFTWTKRPNRRRVGYCSPMMRVVAISCSLDSPDVPENVLDYVVFHETLHLRQGFRPFVNKHDAEFKKMERTYPDVKGCNEILNNIEYS